MTYELKTAPKLVGNPTTNADDATKMTQHINLVIGCVGCTFADVKAEKTVQYVFDKSSTIDAIEAGILPFATAWVAANYVEAPAA